MVMLPLAALALLAAGAAASTESDYWSNLDPPTAVPEGLDESHTWPNRYWEYLHGHARCIPDFFGGCVPMELMTQVCEFNRAADTGRWDGLRYEAVEAVLREDYGLGGQDGVLLTRVREDGDGAGGEGSNLLAQPGEEAARFEGDRRAAAEPVAMPCEMAAQWCRYEAEGCAPEDEL